LSGVAPVNLFLRPHTAFRIMADTFDAPGFGKTTAPNKPSGS